MCACVDENGKQRKEPESPDRETMRRGRGKKGSRMTEGGRRYHHTEGNAKHTNTEREGEEEAKLKGRNTHTHKQKKKPQPDKSALRCA